MIKFGNWIARFKKAYQQSDLNQVCGAAWLAFIVMLPVGLLMLERQVPSYVHALVAFLTWVGFFTLAFIKLAEFRRTNGLTSQKRL